MIQVLSKPQGFVYLTVLSNFARAFDKYHCSYDKTLVDESTYLDKCYFVHTDDISVGLTKAEKLRYKAHIKNNTIILLQAKPDLPIQMNTEGLGFFLVGSSFPLEKIFILNDTTKEFEETTFEEAYAQSLALQQTLLDYSDLLPRTVSVLPIAHACQASCNFCFSKSSASSDQIHHTLDIEHVRRLAQEGKSRGASRFVITGGGEPGLVAHEQLLDLLRLGKSIFPKVVLITNAFHLARLTEEQRRERISEYIGAGLTILSLSRHHDNKDKNTSIMGLDTQTEKVLHTLRSMHSSLHARLICVIQKDGIEDALSLERYLDWAVLSGIRDICFKEIYVSTMLESAYAAFPSNVWSREHQVSLALVTNFLEANSFNIVDRLPWGVPIYAGLWKGQSITIAAYTEPTLYWERIRGIARSWNIMADGSCLVSLEDTASGIMP